MQSQSLLYRSDPKRALTLKGLTLKGPLKGPILHGVLNDDDIEYYFTAFVLNF